tara:strand:- start:93 stop:479 length:387 start_codon:yes stop_codon:yes gene_type:complete
MKITHTIDKKEGLVKVEASLRPRMKEKIAIRTVAIEKYLKENNIKVSHCIKDAFVLNTVPPHSGVWVFALDNKSEKVLQPIKVQETVSDKPSEQVTVPEENEGDHLPKPTRGTRISRTRRKTSTKKDD